MSTSPIPIDEDRWLKIKPKVLLALLGVVAMAVGSWLSIKFDVNKIRDDVQGHSRTFDSIAQQLQSIESDARAAREAVIRSQNQQEIINLKLDYLTGDKRGPRPAPTPP